MRRLISFFVLVSVLLVFAVPTFAAPPTPSHPAGRELGIVPIRGTQTASPLARTNNLVYHNGPVMNTNSTYAIYWVPAGYTISSGYQSLINTFFQNVAADSGKTSNVYYSTTQYYDTVNGNILYRSNFGGAYLDTNAFPASGCTDTVSQTTICLSDAQIQAEIDRVATLNGWARGATNMFFMFTAQNVGSCYSSGSCAFSQYCAYHSSFGSGANVTIYANQPYAETVSAACSAGQRPNGDDADATISVASHEHAEAITDYLGNAWYDRQGAENADKCAWNFGTALGNTGLGLYNQVIGTGKYYIQQEWSNASSGCKLTGL